MIKSATLSQNTKYQVHDFHAEKPFFTVPKIVSEFMDGKVRMYLCEGGRKFVASIYDYYFKVVKTVIKKNGFKGVNSNKKHAFIKDEFSY
jgi:hypothetical protein